MRLTLYKDSILNDKYATVFDCHDRFWSNAADTPFQKYLRQLVQKHFDLPFVYMKESGTITVDITVPQSYDIFEYNYMSLTDDEYKTRYYFINDIELGHNIVSLTYSLDIWHTYSAKMFINNGVIGRARLGVSNLKRALPVAYESSEPPQFVQSASKFYLVAEMSEYVLTSDAENATIRTNFTSFLGHQPQYTETITNRDSIVSRNGYANNRQSLLFSRDEAEEVIRLITQYQGVQPQKKGVTYQEITSSAISINPYRVFDTLLLYSKEYDAGNNQPKLENVRYEIGQIYALPQSMFDAAYIANSANTELELGLKFLISNNLTEGTAYEYTFRDVAFYQFKSDFNGIAIKEHNFEANALTIGYGLRNFMQPLSYNGLDTTIQSIVQINDLGCSVGLNAPDEGYADISAMLEVPLPFTTPSGVERQQQAIAKQQAKIQLASAVATTIASLGSRVAGGYFSVKSAGTHAASQAVLEASSWSSDYLNSLASAAGTTPAGFMTDFALSRAKTARTSAGINAASGSAMTGLYATQHIISAINQLKSPVSAGQPNNTTPNALENAAYGLGKYTIIPNNTAEVVDAVQKIGYSVYIPATDYHRGIISDEALDGGFDIVQYLHAEVSGPFSQSIARELEAIVLAGFRIIYNAD